MTSACNRRFDESYFDTYSCGGHYYDSPWKRAFRTRLVRRYLKGGRLLEIGCAYGYLLRALEGQFKCEGIDVSEHAIAAAKTVTNAELECGDVAQLLPGKPAASYDGVVAFDVLEHLPKQQIPAILSDVARILRPGGMLLASVPNTTCWSRVTKRAQWFGLRDPTHVSLLSPEQWLELFGTHLTVVGTGGDALWDTPYLPVLPGRLQSLPFMATYLLAIATTGRFPRRLSDNLLIAAAKP